ncbi:MAG: MerR family transcriptional regulator, partial [Phycisphaerae bacterium]|nr:MerR family transcriptional regulator [Phycisphaerae bacterium]
INVATRQIKVTKSQHPIQVVSRRTGLTSDVIRAWERRYNAIKPIRAPNSRRLYSDNDVEKLILLRHATLAGRRIGDVATLSIKQLRKLVDADESAVSRLSIHAIQQRPNTGSVMEYFDECLDAITRLNNENL